MSTIRGPSISPIRGDDKLQLFMDIFMDSDLLSSLYQLFLRLSFHVDNTGKTNGGMLERYHWFINNSEYGSNCQYARKCKDLFERFDYEEIRDLFLVCLEEFRKIEGAEFGNGTQKEHNY